MAEETIIPGKTVVIEAKNLKKSFPLGAGQELEILHDLNFQIHSGEFIIIFGPSGCGKSTLLNILAGLEPLTNGSLLVRGEDFAKFTIDKLARYRRSKIGIVFQQYNLLKTMSVIQNVGLSLIAAGWPTDRRLARARHLLSLFGLEKLADKRPPDLSGGEQQRVSLARALAINPWILFCDEPTGNLDSKSASLVIKLLVLLNRKSKRTIIMVTHNQDYLPCANRIFMMKDGVIEKVVVVPAKKQMKPGELEELGGFNEKILGAEAEGER
ncbi:MAG: ABC-type antimicrobial peptide transport system, ATPase component [Candidatus Berkelbacteria bacterium Licking1014_2]|uniref:ABC-type antimicrobial peptide transport system, ATPase component n=1 Tax=Candidatus Berkelbacteria bacterium Licking1014_2 TaxID=2017146 RepID=A0A554LVV0_9BACT|nr:MAG: ABC-type antimicrobial peptide transport system, ATPase component [Candidatus Berkelbacteria bacterium Licking1014_2]